MNVLILTPDAVGSTLLQRLVTIYMQLHRFDRPVVNLHELTNGLGRYYSPEFNREIVSKRPIGNNWGYFQSLQEIVEMLSSVDHYKTSRLAHYHIVRRGDTLKDQVPFYDYLNENFYIIACRRANVFEHALSLSLSRVTKKLNVYSGFEKIESFSNFYKSKLEINIPTLTNTLDDYKKYLEWSQQYFNISSYFNYEKDLPRIEDFILNLPIFSSQSQRITWKETFGLDFESYNQCHYAISDIGSLFLENKFQNNLLRRPKVDEEQQVKDYQKLSFSGWPEVNSVDDLRNLPSPVRAQFDQLLLKEYCHTNVLSHLSPERVKFVEHHWHNYQKSADSINRMVELGIMISGPPIKKQTLLEKRYMIKNFDQCLDVYNDWALQNSEIATPVNESMIQDQIKHETDYWTSLRVSALAESGQLSIEP